MTKSIDFRNLFIIMILKSLYYSENFFFFQYCLTSKRSTTEGLSLVRLVSRLNLEIFKRILMTKTIDFRNLFVSIILKSLCYCDNFFLLILFSTRRVDHRRFVIGLFSL